MPQTLYLDECVSPKLRDRLLLHNPHGFTVMLASQCALGASDADQLRYAAKAQAVLVTHNIADFIWLHRLWRTLQSWQLFTQPHAGILAAPTVVPIDTFGVEIFHFLTQHPPPLLENNMYVFRQGRWARER